MKFLDKEALRQLEVLVMICRSRNLDRHGIATELRKLADELSPEPPRKGK